MTPELERFNHFLIARRADREPIRLSRSPDETVFLAFDLQAKRLTELHVLHAASDLGDAGRRSVVERAVQASELRGGSFARILEVGEDDGLVYYSSSLSDGEFVEDFITRRGALPPATTFCLLLQLLEDLVQLQSYHRLVSGLRLNRLLITALEDTFLQLRIFDFGLSSKEKRTDGDLRRLSVEVCELIFLLLTGRPYAGDNPDKYPALTCLTSGLRSTLRTVLADNSQAPSTLDRLRDDVKEAFAALVSNLQTRNTRRHLVVTNENLLPKSHLQDLLLEDIPVDALLNGRFTVESAEGVRRYPFSIPARSAKSDQSVTVHLLPPSRIVPKDEYEAVPLQMWRFDPQRHPNILRSLTLWESPEWTFLTEEREGGFALSRLIAERIVLNPVEVLALLKQVRDGINQALECGVPRVDLHPSNMLIQLAKGGVLAAREFDRLMQKRVDAWPPFRLKLRPHMTMRNLYEPLLSERPTDADEFDAHFHDKDFRSRAFVALAAYMLTGERLIGRGFEFLETVPQPLAAYVSEALELARRFGKTPEPNDFLAGFEQRVGAVAEDTGLSAAFLRGAHVPVEEMESAGSVSDFEENEFRPAPTPTPARATTRVHSSLVRQAPQRHGIKGLLIWGAVSVAAIFILISLFGGGAGAAAPSTGAAASVALTADARSTTAPAESKPQSAAKRVLIMIRKAIIPTTEEIEESRRKQAGAMPEASPAPVAEQGELADRTSNQ